MSSRSSMLTHFLLAEVRCRESHPPIQLESSSMPAYDRLRLDDNQRACFQSGHKRRKSTRTICLKRQLVDVDASASK
jgi:hypothetical protein